jgi:hypothetical protein
VTHHPSTAGQQKYRRLPWDRVNNGLIINLNNRRGIFMLYFVNRVNYSIINKATMLVKRDVKMPVLNNISSSGHFISL